MGKGAHWAYTIISEMVVMGKDHPAVVLLDLILARNIFQLLSFMIKTLSEFVNMTYRKRDF